ncbi:germination protein, Ger(x)C family [Paenibacillus algorifonticola]|uniref:Germination protein, Ger(X)C family n=1 Tax=Paenibacillus algorifonticola TaxID=684063 RepID=A0A1I1Z6B2_9BACL|nr:Ger(x)C family spore germination protein [Paenibacillus algorifonticola]SFE27092.1 germination protein, Ger(x)C family [Paenibacillus algorifonticola]
MNVWIKWGLIAGLLLLSPGCFDSKPIQNMAYVTAIGLDYKDGHFITYAQVLNFLNVAKSDKNEIGKNIPVWIGRGTGKTVTEALSSLSETSQIRMFWGHVKAIVVDEELLKSKAIVRQSYEAINRYREVRYNILLYSTKTPMIDIFKQKSIFNLPALDSILDTPEDVHAQRSNIDPQYGYKFIAEFNEPGITAMIPTIGITKEVWREDAQKKPMFKITGAFFIRQNEKISWFSETELLGRKWVQKENKRSILLIGNKEEPTATLVIIKPHYRIRHVRNNKQLQFKVELKARAFVEEMIKDATVKEMEALAAKAIRDEMMATYEKGLATQTDLLNLFAELYRSDAKLWHQLHNSKQLLLNQNTLGQIDVKVTISNTGKYKGRL